MKITTAQRAFSLLEVLIAWLILMVVLLGIVEMQMLALKSVHRSYLKTIATIQLASMYERLRANPTSVARMRERSLWNQQNKILLPKGSGSFQCVQHVCTIQLQWKIKKIQRLKITAVLA